MQLRIKKVVVGSSVNIPAPGESGKWEVGAQFPEIHISKIKHKVSQISMLLYTCLLLSVALLPIKKKHKHQVHTVHRMAVLPPGTALLAAALCHSWHWGSRCPLEAEVCLQSPVVFFHYSLIPILLTRSLGFCSHHYVCFSFPHSCPSLPTPPCNLVLVWCGQEWS